MAFINSVTNALKSFIGVEAPTKEQALASLEREAVDAKQVAANKEATIASLNARADTAAEQGDRSVIAEIESELATERRLFTVAQRVADEAQSRVEAMRVAIAEDAAQRDAQARADRIAELDSRLTPEALAATLAPINADIFEARERLLAACKKHEDVRAEYAADHEARVALGAGAETPVERPICRLNLALQNTNDDPARIASLIQDGDHTNLLYADRAAGAVPLDESFAGRSTAWVTPGPYSNAALTPRRAQAFRQIADLARSVRTIRELSTIAKELLANATDADKREESEAFAQSPEEKAAKRKYDEVQERGRKGIAQAFH